MTAKSVAPVLKSWLEQCDSLLTTRQPPDPEDKPLTECPRAKQSKHTIPSANTFQFLTWMRFVLSAKQSLVWGYLKQFCLLTFIQVLRWPFFIKASFEALQESPFFLELIQWKNKTPLCVHKAEQHPYVHYFNLLNITDSVEWRTKIWTTSHYKCLLRIQLCTRSLCWGKGHIQVSCISLTLTIIIYL